MRVDTAAISGTTISNTAQVVSDETPVVDQTNAVTHTVTVSNVLTSTLIASKSATPISGSFVQSDDLITYTITVSNAGNTTLNNIVITDSLPISTTFVSSDTVNGSITGPDPLVFTLSSLPANQQETFTFTVRVDAVAISGTTISNTAQVVSDETPLDQTNTVTHTVTDALTGTLVALKSATPPHGSTVQPDDLIIYTVTVTNESVISLTNVMITDTIPANTSFISSDATQGTTVGPDPLEVNFGTLNPGQTATLTFTVQVNSAVISGTIISNIAEFKSDQTALINTNVVTHIVQSNVLTDGLIAVKSATPPHGSTVSANDLITYTVTVTNQTAISLTNVMVTDTIPANTSYLSTSATQGVTVGFNPLVVNFGTLGPNQTATLTFTVQVDTSVMSGTIISNIAEFISDQTTLSTTNVVTHIVGAHLVYLPIIENPVGTADATLTWVSQAEDRVQEADGSAGGLSSDGQNDGQFLLTVTVSPVSKNVDFVELVSDQSGSPTWDTVIDTDPVLGIYDGSTQQNASDGTVTGLPVDTLGHCYPLCL